MFSFLGRLITGHAWKLCTAWLVAGFLLSLLAPSWDARPRDGDVRYLPERCDSVRGQRLYETTFPREGRGSGVVLAWERPDGLTPADLALAGSVRNDLSGVAGLQVEPVRQIDERLTVVRASLPGGPRSQHTCQTVDRIEDLARSSTATLGGSAPRLTLAGSAAAGRDQQRAAFWTGLVLPVGLVVVFLAVLFALHRRPLLAAAGTAVAAVSTWVGLKLIALTAALTGGSLGEFSEPVVAVVLFGTAAVAVMFLLRRLQEELVAGESLLSATTRTTSTLGTRLLVGAAVVACGWLMLGFSEYGRLQSVGMTLLFGLASVVVGCLLLTPAAYRLLGSLATLELALTVPAAWSPVLHRLMAERWLPIRDRVMRLVSEKPAVVGVVLVVLLTPLALYGLRVRVADRSEVKLSPRAVSSRGTTALEQHGVGGEAGPLTVLLVSPADWTSQAGRDCLAHVGDSLGRLPDVASVRSLVSESRPTGPMTTVLGPENEWLPRRAAHVARVEVVFKPAPGSADAMAALETVQAWLRDRLPATTQGLGSVSWACAGSTVTARDLGRVAAADGSRAAWLMLAVLLAVLAVLVGRIETVVHLVLAVVITYPAALGVAGLLGVLWGGTFGEVDWPTAALLFPILVAGGAGLSLIPVNRSQASGGRGQEPEDKLRRNLIWTSRRTAGCGLLLAGLWAVLLLVGRGVTARLGIAVTAGLLIDALVVRRVLVPALAVYLVRQRKELQGGWRKLQEPELIRRAG